MYIFRAIKTIFLVLLQIIFQLIITYIYVYPVIKKYSKKYKTKISKSLKVKIYYQYTVFVPSILLQLYSFANNKKITFKERKYLTLLGAISPIFDDFYDDNLLLEHQIKLILLKPETYQSHSFSECVFLELYNEILKNINNKELFIQNFLNLHKAQTESLKQIKGNLEQNELQKITFQKGAEGYFLFLSFFGNKISTSEIDLYFYLGSIFQLANDGFDIFKDLQNNIQTMANSTNNFVIYSDYYLQLIDLCIFKIDESNCIKNKEYFKSLLLLFTSLTIVAHKQIEILDKINPSWNLNSHLNRKEIICDMAKLKNKIAYLKIANLLLKKYTL